MSKRNIYLLELEQGYYFVVAREPGSHFIPMVLELVLQYGFLKSFAPLRILDQWSETTPLDVDYQVKKQMAIYGIDKVRGGSYLSAVLEPEQQKLLECELGIGSSPNVEETCDESVIKEILTQYENVPLDHLPIIRKRVGLDYAKYLEECAAISAIKMDFDGERQHVDWLLEKCRKIVNEPKNSLMYHLLYPKEVELYRQILRQLHHIYQTFMTIYKKSYLATDLPIEYPEFVFDDFMYHGHRTHLPSSLDKAERICEAYYFFLTYLENRYREMEFDVASWGPSADWKFPRELYLLSMSIKKM